MIQLTDDKIKEIGEDLTMGMKCFVHRQTGDLVTHPDEDQMDDPECWQEDLDKLEAEPDAYLEITPMRSRDSYLVMERFVETVSSAPLRNRLQNALNRPKPFRNFSDIIDNAGDYRDEWFAFRDSQLMDWVREQLETDEEF